MTEKYQRIEFDTSSLAVPERPSVAMDEIAADMREGQLSGVLLTMELCAAGAESERSPVAGPCDVLTLRRAQAALVPTAGPRRSRSRCWPGSTP